MAYLVVELFRPVLCESVVNNFITSNSIIYSLFWLHVRKVFSC